MPRRRALIASALLAPMLPHLAFAGEEPGVPPADRELRVPVAGGSLYVRVNGDLNGPRPPLLLVHGGPGGALWQFFPALPLAADRAIILYDQLDSGRSDAPGDPANWTVDRFVSEIGAIRSALNLKRMHLLGHSWGGIVAARYAAGRPSGLQSLILQGTPLSDRRLSADVRTLYAALPDGAGAVLAAGDSENPGYGAAMGLFMKKHFARTSVRAVALPYMTPVPEDRGDALAAAMTGNKLDGFGGALKGFDDEPLLARITAPTLLLRGEFDLVSADSQRALRRMLKRGAAHDIAGAGHMTQFDQPEAWRAEIAEFLRAHDS